MTDPSSRTSKPRFGSYGPVAWVVVIDDEDRENEGDLTMAAEAGHPRSHQFHGDPRTGTDLPGHDRERLDELDLARWCRTTPRRTAPRSRSRST